MSTDPEGAPRWAIRAFVSRTLRRLRRVLSPALLRSDVLTKDDRATGLEVLYRLLLARQLDEAGRSHYLRLMAVERMTLREVATEIAMSDEFQERLRRRVLGPVRTLTDASTRPESFVDIKEMLKAVSLDELIDSADEYYRKTLSSTDRYHARPVADLPEAPDMLGAFAHLLAGLRLATGMKILDFGAGTCWTTRFLIQLGCDVAALDVSSTALTIGRELFQRLPPIGETQQPHFLLFDGRHIDMPSASVDRIVCFDAFHHIPNPDEVLAELARVLRPGGIAGFSEPGPTHSKSSQAQFEMKNFAVVENDVVMTDLWRSAKAVGFTDIELAVFSTESYRVSLSDFEDLIAGGPPLEAYGDVLRGFLRGHQMFFLTKGTSVPDSRQRGGLKGEIEVKLDRVIVRSGEALRGRARVRNVGTAIWMPGSTRVGGVNIGIHLRTRDGKPLDASFGRVQLLGLEPGAAQSVDFILTPPPPGDYVLEFDLVSEGIGWFEICGSTSTTLAVSVR